MSNVFTDGVVMQLLRSDRIPRSLRDRYQASSRRESIVEAYSGAVAYAIAKKKDYALASALIDTSTIDGRGALKTALIAAIASTPGVIDKEDPPPSVILPPALDARIIATFMQDAPSWFSLRDWLALDSLQPGWLRSRLADILTEVRVCAYIIPPGHSMQHSRILQGRMRMLGNTSMAPVRVTGVSSDDVVMAWRTKDDDRFVFIAPYAYSKSANRNSLEVACYVVVEAGYTAEVKNMFGIDWGDGWALNQPEVQALAKSANVEQNIVMATRIANELERHSYVDNHSVHVFFDRFLDRHGRIDKNISESALTEYTAVEALFEALCVARGMPLRSLKTAWVDIQRLWLLTAIKESAVPTDWPRYTNELATSKIKLTKDERADLLNALKAKRKDRKRYSYEYEIEYLDALIAAVKSA